ncbi:hypothetical protein G4Y79_03695 [Phototrophicus methaneseepsis]|uniref:Uncharacterized protein n=1 Tax=Phototrophicus methaneseepsis TaxID=2710758 RepID=A0A7S8EAP6_9CHLR|nr:hypothetical protein [Phototrophicus methaneseepsis]QPC83497.1 hypothetical protein G4Y79_03695 [Phototrophicus methaneseepsis]
MTEPNDNQPTPGPISDAVNTLDFALAVEGIYPNARFRRADTYAALVRTWEDTRPVPTLIALQASWQAYLEAQAKQSQKADALDQQRKANRDRLNVDDFRDTSPQIKALVNKLAWLEAEILDLRSLDNEAAADTTAE